MKGKLILIPTPIDETTPLEPVALEILKNLHVDNSIIAVEELKECRRRWIRWGLEREWIDRFVLYNEHTRETEKHSMIKELIQGKNVYLMSDCGLPAFCDPGSELVSLAHDNSITVTSTPFSNSISLALALSGFEHSKFIFEGFLPSKSDERKSEFHRIFKNKYTTIIMDTPYRFKKILEELLEYGDNNKRIVIAKNLNQSNESIERLNIGDLKQYKASEKCEFIILIEN